MLPALISMLITIVVAAVVGLRLLRLSRRTHGMPEISAGVGLLTFAVAQICTLVMVGAHGSLSPGASEFLRVLVLVAFTVVSTGLAAFTIYMFGPVPWRWAVGATVILAGILVRVAIFVTGTPVVGEGDAGRVLPSLAAASIAVIFLWMGIEGVAYHRKVARARVLGLTSAEVVNRFWVFGMGGLISGLLTTAVAISGFLGAMDTVGRPLILTAGLINSVVWTLCFTPPAAYRRFIETRAARFEASHG